MKQAVEYRQHASECRKLAMGARNEQERRQLLDMAAAWERMAMDRDAQMRRDQGLPASN
jgi:hypothetical protein